MISKNLWLSLLLLSVALSAVACAAVTTPTAVSTATRVATATSAPTATRAPTATMTAAYVPPTETATAKPTEIATSTPMPTNTLHPTLTPTEMPTVSPDDPNRASRIDGQPHNIAAKSALWYAFDYAINHMTGKRTLLTIALVNGNNSGVDFEVYAPENISEWWNNHPTGRGTVYMIDCATGQPSETGECQSTDLIWQGDFGADGTYYVRVVNTNNSQISYLLTIQSTIP